jgi:predicted ATPase/DNA-binding winged helix-turn-helix (wHTH) protein
MNISLTAAAPIAFGRHAFDPWRGELRTTGARPVALGGRAARVLQALIGAAGQVLTPAQLIERAWPDRAIHASNVRVQIAALRRALAGDRDLIGTVSGGYVFKGSVARVTMPALVGRTALLAHVAARLATTPIVTLTGPAGVGKSALAQGMAHHRRVAVDELPTADEATLVAAVAKALGLPPAPSLARLVTALPHAPLLLVLDNCDYALDAVSRLAEALTRHRPALRILATSRQALRADGEAVVRVPPLDLDDGVRLLLARAYGGCAALAPAVLAAAADTSRRLGALPLALVLAGMWLRRVPADERLAALARVEPDRLADPANPVERHRSLRAAAGWSEALLPPSARQALAMLERLPAGFTLAQAVARLDGSGGADPVELLATLAAHSLLAADTAELPARYRLL